MWLEPAGTGNVLTALLALTRKALPREGGDVWTPYKERAHGERMESMTDARGMTEAGSANGPLLSFPVPATWARVEAVVPNWPVRKPVDLPVSTRSPAGTADRTLNGAIDVDAERIRGHFDELVRSTVKWR